MKIKRLRYQAQTFSHKRPQFVDESNIGTSKQNLKNVKGVNGTLYPKAGAQRFVYIIPSKKHVQKHMFEKAVVL